MGVEMRRIGRLAVSAGALAIVLPGAELPAEARPRPSPRPSPTPSAPAVPSGYRVRTLISGLDHPWDVAFRPNGSMFVTEREGWIGLWRNGHYRRILRPAGLVSNGEGGMLGIAVSPRFRRNRRIFVCFNTASDVRVVRFVFARHPLRLIRRRDIVTGIPANPSGRHSGCRPRFGPDGYLWVTTGDAALGTNPQNLNSLGGKVLRVNGSGPAAHPATSAAGSSPTASATRRGSRSGPATARRSSSSTGPTATTRSRRCAGAATAGGTRWATASSTTRTSR